MFSFFKRFKGAPAPTGQEPSPEQAQQQVAAPPTGAPAPERAQPAEAAPPGATPDVPADDAALNPSGAAGTLANQAPEPSGQQPETPSVHAMAPATNEPVDVPIDVPVDVPPDALAEIVPPPAPAPAEKKSWMNRLRQGLSKTSLGLTGIFISVKIDEALYEELESALIMSDAGHDATQYLLQALREKVRTERLGDGQQVKVALRELLADLLRPLERSLVLGRVQPLVMMVTGVNGAGKTTSIGKLAKHLQRFDQSVLLAAGDTFRAAAREQLAVWGQRNGVTVVSQEGGDAAAVIFDAVGAARARKVDVLMADTAGRLPTQLHLMEELKKVKRVIGKAQEGAPHEVLLVIDANTGQNALAQVKAFDDALGLSGLIVTKLDGTAKGGILAAIARQRPIPVYFIGVGESVDDLQPFVAQEFAEALLG